MTSFQTDDIGDNEKSLDAMILECVKDKYKISYAALRWAKEIKQKENLPDPIPRLLPRALREILTGMVPLKDIEELPVVVKISPAAPGAQAVPAPTLNMKPEETNGGDLKVEFKAPEESSEEEEDSKPKAKAKVKEAEVEKDDSDEESADEDSGDDSDEEVDEEEEEKEEEK